MRARQPAGQGELWVVLPLRGFGRGKSRLAGALDPAARMRLSRRLFGHSLQVLDRWLGGLDHCVVISPCTRALRMAARSGALGLAQPRPSGGLNPAVGHAVRFIMRRGGRRVLILPCDLPLLCVSALDALYRPLATGSRIVIAPDRSASGTNAMLLRVPMRSGFRFGPHSFGLHRELARARGLPLAVCECTALGLDLDTPTDLAHWAVRHRGRWGR